MARPRFEPARYRSSAHGSEARKARRLLMPEGAIVEAIGSAGTLVAQAATGNRDSNVERVTSTVSPLDDEVRNLSIELLG